MPSLPALSLSIAALCGAALGFNVLEALIPLAILLFFERRGYLAFFALLSFLYVNSSVLLPQEEEIEGVATLSIESVKEGRRSLSLTGSVQSFEGKGGELLAKNIRFMMPMPKAKWPKSTLTLRAKAKKLNAYTLKIKPLEEAPQDPSSLYKSRYELKKRIKAWLLNASPTRRSAEFLGGLLTGSIFAEELSGELARFALQHILAISGFHFSLMALLLSLLFRLFLKERGALISLLVSLSFYTLFLGYSPSIFRSFIMAGLFFLSQLLYRTSYALNNLGAALLAILIVDPLALFSIGFQFSFLITASILLYTPLLAPYFEKLLPKRNYKELLTLKTSAKIGALFLAFLRGALALTAAVELTSLPLSLYHFENYPLQSVLYNLFFPSAVAIFFPFLLLSALLWFTPLITLCGFGIELLLKTVYGYPTYLEAWLTAPSLPLWLFTLYFSLLMLLPLYKKKEERELFSYL